jgi:hypothetical protein
MDSAKIKADEASGIKIVEESTGVRANMTSNVGLISGKDTLYVSGFTENKNSVRFTILSFQGFPIPEI